MERMRGGESNRKPVKSFGEYPNQVDYTTDVRPYEAYGRTIKYSHLRRHSAF